MGGSAQSASSLLALVYLVPGAWAGTGYGGITAVYEVNRQDKTGTGAPRRVFGCLIGVGVAACSVGLSVCFRSRVVVGVGVWPACHILARVSITPQCIRPIDKTRQDNPGGGRKWIWLTKSQCVRSPLVCVSPGLGWILRMGACHSAVVCGLGCVMWRITCTNLNSVYPLSAPFVGNAARWVFLRPGRIATAVVAAAAASVSSRQTGHFSSGKRRCTNLTRGLLSGLETTARGGIEAGPCAGLHPRGQQFPSTTRAVRRLPPLGAKPVLRCSWDQLVRSRGKPPLPAHGPSLLPG